MTATGQLVGVERSGAAPSSLKHSSVGTVVIGRNEGDRLRRCLRSLGALGRDVVYVDSGSTDGSVEFAKSVGAGVVLLDRSLPFTAARARNAGFQLLLDRAPGVRYVQFVDGDCELEPGWIDAAIKELEREPIIAAICGHLRERSPEASIYNRLADLEWHRPVGDVPHCGGIFIAAAAAFSKVGGFDPGIAAGEEPDICCRLRAEGYRITRIDCPMATHDLNMTRFSQWWRRSVRGGYGALRLTLFGPRVSRPAFRSQVRSVLFWALLLPAFCIAIGSISAFAGMRTASAVCFAAWPGFVLLQGARLALRARRRGLRVTHAVAAGFFATLWKYAAFVGFARCLLDRALRERSGDAPAAREFHKAAVPSR